ncbi:MAG: hypothetical protein R2847_12015 [Bacteroidia bacterium]
MIFAENVVAEKASDNSRCEFSADLGAEKYAMRIWMGPATLPPVLLHWIVLNALNKGNVELPAGKLASNKTELIAMKTPMAN